MIFRFVPPGTIGAGEDDTDLQSPATVLKESKANLAKIVNDRSRKITIRGNQAIVPLKFDEDGNPATVDKLLFKRLSLTDLKFLAIFRRNDWDIEKTITEIGISRDVAEKLVKKVACFREEDAKVKALCEIPTPSWIAAKHVENFYEGGKLEDSQHKSLQELAKIEGAYKNTSQINIQNNVFQMPTLTPEQSAELKALGDRLANAVDTEQVA